MTVEELFSSWLCEVEEGTDLLVLWFLAHEQIKEIEMAKKKCGGRKGK